MKLIFLLFILIFSCFPVLGINKTVITTNEGIEIFQNEKYYILKGEVKINSEKFILEADIIKAYFDKNMYDIIKIEALGNSNLESLNGIRAKGEKIYFSASKDTIEVKGLNSFIINNEIEMYSDKYIKIDNLKGYFNLKGNNSKLVSQDTIMIGNSISGFFENKNGLNDLIKLEIEDDIEINIKSKNVDMYGKRATYNKADDIIELFKNVRIHRNNETVTGDYAKINLIKESYKVTSNNTSNKVKIILENDE